MRRFESSNRDTNAAIGYERLDGLAKQLPIGDMVVKLSSRPSVSRVPPTETAVICLPVKSLIKNLPCLRVINKTHRDWHGLSKDHVLQY